MILRIKNNSARKWVECDSSLVYTTKCTGGTRVFTFEEEGVTIKATINMVFVKSNRKRLSFPRSLDFKIRVGSEFCTVEGMNLREPYGTEPIRLQFWK